MSKDGELDTKGFCSARRRAHKEWEEAERERAKAPSISSLKKQQAKDAGEVLQS